MSKEYTVCYLILKECELIVSKQVGLIELEGLISSMKSLGNQLDFSPTYNFLIDIRKSEFSKNVNNVNSFVLFLKENFLSSLKRKIAFLTKDSDQVAMATLFKMLQNRQARNIHVFSTLKHALIWLHADIDASGL